MRKRTTGFEPATVTSAIVAQSSTNVNQKEITKEIVQCDTPKSTEKMFPEARRMLPE